MKRNIIFMFLLLLAITSVGCNHSGNDGDEGVIRITYWNSITGPDGAQMKAMIKLFNDEYEGQIEVLDTPVSELDHYSNLDLLVPIGKGPDIALMHSHRVESYKRSNIIVPLEEYIAASDIEFNVEDYITSVFNSLTIDGELYGIPLDVHTVGIYYNKDLLEKYDLEVPTNREELISTAKTVQTGEQIEGKNVWGIPLSTVWPSEWLYTTSLYQNGGIDVNSEGNPGFDTNAGRAALRAVADIVHIEELSPEKLNVDQDLFYFEQGNALFHFNGSWMLESIIDSSVNFGVIPVSNMFATSGPGDFTDDIYVRSHAFVVPKQIKTVSVEKQKAIMTFIKFIGDHSYMWATVGQIPASQIARDSDEYQSLPYLSGFGDVEKFRVAGRSAYYLEAFGPVFERVTTAISEKNYNADALISSAADEANRIIAELR